MSLARLESVYCSHFQCSTEVTISPIKKGASGRTIVKLSCSDAPEVIGIHYTHERSDNALHKPVSDLLEGAGVRVPEILFADLDENLLLVEYVGSRDLLSLRSESFQQRLPYYEKTFQELYKISKVPAPFSGEMMPAFTEETYQWEQDYFATHYLSTHLGEDSHAFLENEVMKALAKELGGNHPDLVHRDFQSQNIMVNGGEVYVIDFQGARPGYVEYDLASFIYDPYMKHSFEEREGLRSLWEKVSGRSLDRGLMRKCALQRLMQALGAYGNIVHNQQNEWYAQHMAPAAEMLLALTKETEYEEIFHTLLNSRCTVK